MLGFSLALLVLVGPGPGFWSVLVLVLVFGHVGTLSPVLILVWSGPGFGWLVVLPPVPGLGSGTTYPCLQTGSSSLVRTVFLINFHTISHLDQVLTSGSLRPFHQILT